MNYTSDALALLQRLITTPSVSREETEAANIMEQRSASGAISLSGMATTYG